MPGTHGILADLLSMKLEEHLKAMGEIEAIIRSMTPADLGGDEFQATIRDAVKRLRGLRRAMIADAERIIASIKSGELPGEGDADALYALAGYYAEAAYYKEMRLLQKLGIKEGDPDTEDAARLRLLFQEILRYLE